MCVCVWVSQGEGRCGGGGSLQGWGLSWREGCNGTWLPGAADRLQPSPLPSFPPLSTNSVRGRGAGGPQTPSSRLPWLPATSPGLREGDVASPMAGAVPFQPLGGRFRRGGLRPSARSSFDGHRQR